MWPQAGLPFLAFVRSFPCWRTSREGGERVGGLGGLPSPHLILGSTPRHLALGKAVSPIFGAIYDQAPE